MQAARVFGRKLECNLIFSQQDSVFITAKVKIVLINLTTFVNLHVFLGKVLMKVR